MKEDKWIFHGIPDVEMLSAARKMILESRWHSSRMACQFMGNFYSAERNKSGSYTIRRLGNDDTP